MLSIWNLIVFRSVDFTVISFRLRTKKCVYIHTYIDIYIHCWRLWPRKNCVHNQQLRFDEISTKSSQCFKNLLWQLIPIQDNFGKWLNKWKWNSNLVFQDWHNEEVSSFNLIQLLPENNDNRNLGKFLDQHRGRQSHHDQSAALFTS